MGSFEGKNYYEILGVAKDADADVIRKAHRDKARKLHPDVNKAADAAAQFAKVQEAYDVLSDPEKRAAYDNFLRYGVRAGGPAGAGGGQQWQGGGFGGFDPADFATIFEQFMGGGRRAGGGARPDVHMDFDFGPGGPRAGRHRAQPRRGRDVRQTISVPFMTAATGGTEKLRLSVDGSSQTIDVRIPPGVESGAKLRLKGQGEDGGATARGDLILTINVVDHSFFRRDGLDVLLDVPITFAEAVQGTTVTLPLLAGRIDLRVPPGAATGQRLRVKGRGIRGRDSTGDFFAVIQIVAPDPKTLTDGDRDFFRDLGARLKNPREALDWSDSTS